MLRSRHTVSHGSGNKYTSKLTYYYKIMQKYDPASKTNSQQGDERTAMNNFLKMFPLLYL